VEGIDEIFRQCYRTGYQRIELMPEFLAPEARQKTLAALRNYKLKPTAVYLSGPLHQRDAAEESRAQALELARVMKDTGTRFINFSPAAKPREESKTDEELETQAYQLNRMGDELAGQSMRLLLHHHVSEMRADAREWRYMRRRTEPKLVSFCLDVDWIRRAGMDPLVLMDEAAGRLGSLHLRNSRNGVWLEELADGDIDLERIARFLKQMFYDGLLVVELVYDKGTKRVHSLPLALSLSRWYMQKTFGARPGMKPVDMGPPVMMRRL
jgi:inosose dehydratase